MRSAALSLLATCLAASIATCATAADPAHPAVVELFQSQGCSSCPPANTQLLAIASRPDILALSWEVTYWDYLGWTDTFGSPAFTQRQIQYAASHHTSGVYTPQIIVNGRTDGPGTTAPSLATLLAQGDRGPSGPTITLTQTQATISAGTGAAQILLIRYNPQTIQVPIHHGENAGAVLPHRNIVRQVTTLGDWHGAPATFLLPATTSNALKTAILVQEPGPGRILAAATQ